MKYHFENRPSDLNTRARANFVQKVYSILSIQLGVTALFVILNIYSATFAYIQYAYGFLQWVMLAVAIVSLIVLSKHSYYLVSSPRLCQTYPTNLALLGLFTLA